MKILYWSVPVLAFIQLDFVVHRGKPISKADCRELFLRRDGIGLALEDERAYFKAKLEIGTPKQKLEVILDTGSSDLWVPANNCTSELQSNGNVKRFSDTRNGAYSRKRLRKSSLSKDGGNHMRARGITKRNSYHGRTSIPPSTQTPDIAFSRKKYDVDSYNTNTESTSLPRSSSSRWSSYSRFLPTTTYNFSAGSTATASASSGVSLCTSHGTFATERSFSFGWSQTLGAFSMSYFDGTFAYGNYGSDDVTLGTQSVKGLNFGVCDHTDSQMGVLGIGLPGGQSSNLIESSSSQQYENLPMLMKSQELIKKILYSVSLGGSNASEGSILFGAIDYSKFVGNLTRVRMLQVQDEASTTEPVYIEIALNSISGEELAVNYTTVVILDTGFTISMLPKIYINALKSHVKSSEQFQGLWLCSCDYLNSKENIIFDFSGAKIPVPLKDLVMRYNGRCVLGIRESEGVSLLGVNFFRSAYIAFDLEEFEVALAPASDAGGEPNIEEVISTIPGAITAELYDSTFEITSTASESKSYLAHITESFSDKASNATQVPNDEDRKSSSDAFSASTSGGDYTEPALLWFLSVSIFAMF